MMTLAPSGPSRVPMPPTSDTTTALVESSKPNRCGATNPRSSGYISPPNAAICAAIT